MKRALRLALVPIALTGIIVTFSCSDSEHRIPFGVTKVVIKLNLPKDNASTEVSILERIRRFLIPDAMAQEAPAAFSSILVRVTGPDITPIEQSFTPTGDTISMTVTAGAIRNFEVIAYVAPEDPSAALSFRGTASANCPSGSTVSVPVVMMLNETKIVLPDPGAGSSPNERIIQIDDITGAGYVVRTGAEIAYPLSNFRPWDIDYDARGRIYIAVNVFSSPDAYPKIIRMNSITSTDFEPIVSMVGEGFRTLAIDRTRGLLYCATAYALYRCNIDGSGLTEPVTIPGITILVALAVDGGGELYILGDDGSQNFGVYAYDFDAMSVSAPYTSELGVTNTGPEDIMIRGSSVYIANPDGADGYKVIELTTGLAFVAAYGSESLTLPDMNTGRFYGPRRFAAIRNDELIIIDDYNDGLHNYDKLIALTNMGGDGWETFPTSGDGQSYFSFFYGT